MRGIKRLYASIVNFIEKRKAKSVIEKFDSEDIKYIDYVRNKLEVKHNSVDVETLKKIKLFYENKKLSSQETINYFSFISCIFAVIAVLISTSNSGITKASLLLKILFGIIAFIIIFLFIFKPNIKLYNTVISVLEDIIQKREKEIQSTEVLQEINNETTSKKLQVKANQKATTHNNKTKSKKRNSKDSKKPLS